MIRWFRERLFPRDDLRGQIKNLFGFTPGNLALYQQAFRHKSVAIKNGNGTRLSNERLEFLGDAVLDAIVADFLFKRFPYKDEGFLTQMRSKLVSRNHLNKLSLKLGINNLINSNPDQAYFNKSMHGNAFEAFIGALYLDKGYRETEQIVVSHIFRLHVDIEEILAQETNYKSRLIEWTQQHKKTLEFSVVDEVGSGYSKQYIVEVQIDGKTKAKGRDFSIKGAEQEAAAKTFEQLQEEDPNVN